MAQIKHQAVARPCLDRKAMSAWCASSSCSRRIFEATCGFGIRQSQPLEVELDGRSYSLLSDALADDGRVVRRH